MPRTRTPRAVDVIDGELVELRAERRDYTRANNRLFAEDILANAERAVSEARARADALAADFAVSGMPPLGHPFVQAFAEAAAIAGAGEILRAAAEQVAAAVEGPSKAEVEKRLADFDGKLAALEQERRDAEYAARREALDSEFATT